MFGDAAILLTNTIHFVVDRIKHTRGNRVHKTDNEGH